MPPHTVMILIGAALIITAVYFLNKHSITKFQYSFISKPTLVMAMVYSGCLYGATQFYLKGDQGYSVVLTWSLAAIGVVMIGVLIRINCVQTNLRYGLCGSAIQIPLLMVVSVSAIPILVVALFLKMLSSFGNAPPLPRKTQFQKDQEWYYDRMNKNGFHKKW